jgi:hypothetical protein
MFGVFHSGNVGKTNMGVMGRNAMGLG